MPLINHGNKRRTFALLLYLSNKEASQAQPYQKLKSLDSERRLASATGIESTKVGIKSPNRSMRMPMQKAMGLLQTVSQH